MKTTFQTALIALAVASAPLAIAQLPADSEVEAGHMPEADVAFLRDANSANITQIAMGHTAETGATNPGVHSLATRIVSSHVKADQALQLLAAQKHVDLAREPGPADHDEIEALHHHRRGAAFDNAYVQDVLDDHDRMIAMYIAARDQSVDPDIRRYADIMLPALRDNRDQADALVKQQPGNSRD